MADVFHIQSNFARGQLDPILHSRVDFDGYYKGARKLKDVIITNQTALKRRFGTRFLYNIGVYDRDEVRLEIYQFNATYALLIFYRNKCSVFDSDGVFQTEFDTGFTANVVKEFDIAQSFNDIIIVHGSMSPQLLSAVTFPTVWSLRDLQFNNKPVYAFDRTYEGITFTIQDVNPSVDLSLGNNVTITTSSPVFNNDYIGGLLFAFGAAVRIKEITSFGAKGVLIQPFFQVGEKQITVAPGEALLSEPAFSEKRGWPKTVTFYQGRLVFGGTTLLPTLLTLSNINSFNNFDDSGAAASNAITILLNSDKVNDIKKIVGFNTLIIFTSTTNFVLQATDQGAITPTNAAFQPQNQNGVSNIAPAILDNQVFYVEKESNMVRSYTYDVRNMAFSDINISILSQTLIEQPLFMLAFRSRNINDGEFLFISNGDNAGNLAVFQSNKNEDLAGWSYCETDGKFGSMATFDNFLYFAIERDGEIYIEQLDYDSYMDSAFFYEATEPTTSIGGLGHLEGKEVNVIADGFVKDNQIVTHGKITLVEPAAKVQVGLPITPEIIPMPVAINVGNGQNTFYMKQKIQRIYVNYVNSLGITVNGELIPFLSLNTPILGVVPTPKTGTSELPSNYGWDPKVNIVFSQNIPAPMIISGISYKVEV